MTKSTTISVDHLTDEEHKQQEVMWELNNSIPLNRFGLPRFIFRLDYLPYHRFQSDNERPREVDPEPEIPTGEREDAPRIFPQSELPPEDLPEELDLTPFEGHGQDPVSSDANERSSWFDLVPSEEMKQEKAALLEQAGGDLGDLGDLDADGETSPQIGGFSRQQLALHAGFTSEELANARVILRYEGGYPVLPDGRSFWSRMDWEPPEAHMAFNVFLFYSEQHHSPRILSRLPETLQEESGVEMPLERIQLYHDLYYWSWRAAAYDAFREQEYRYRMEHRMRQTLDTHYDYAESLITRLMEYMNDEEEFWEMMTPKAASELFSKLISTQRISSGLPSSGPPNEARTGSGSSTSTTLSVAMRGGKGGAGSQEVRTIGDDNGVIDLGGGQSLESISSEALKDPETAHLFQELIIKLTTEEHR